MSYVKSLRTTLKEKNECLFNRLEEIENLAKSVLTYTSSKFPYYTPHDFKHSLNVEENLNWLIPDSCKQNMNGHEIFFLIVSAWLHDWGMVGSPNEDAKQIREVHHVRTEEFFEKLHDKIRLSLNEARIIGRISRGHRQENLLDPKFDDLYFRSNIRIRTRYLSALLRIADECDVTENRVPEIIYYSLNPKGVSETEFKKHLDILGIGQPEPYKLQLNGVARDPKGVKVLEEVKKRIQKELNQVKSILAKEDIMLEYIELNVDTRGFINRPIEFTIDREKIVDLLIGKSLYRRIDAGIRELLQNALDACRLRSSLEKGYTPSITFSFDKEKISVIDNGIGMNFETANDYLSNIGKSYFLSKEFEELRVDRTVFDPISRFGIGILSCFLIASKVKIETKKKGSDPCRFIIDDLAEGWRYEQGTTQAVGSKITLYLNQKGKEVDVEKALQYYARAIEIPILVVNEDTGQKKYLEQQWDNKIPEMTEYLSLFERAYFPRHKPRLDFYDTVKTEGIEATYYHYELLGYSSVPHYLFLNQGLFVGSAYCCNAVDGRTSVLVNLTKNIIDLNVSRESFIQNEKFNNFVARMYDNVFLLLKRRFIEETRDKKLSKLDKCVTFAQIIHKFIGEANVIKSPLEKNILQEFFQSLDFPVITSNGLRVISGKSIISKKREKIYVIRLFPFKNCQIHLRDIVPFVQDSLGPDDLVVFYIVPEFSYETESGISRAFNPIIELLKNNVETVRLKIQELMSRMKFKKYTTKLDRLLPRNSFFTRVPQQWRSLVIPIKFYDFGKNAEVVYIFETLCAIDIFADDVFLGKFWKNLLKQEMEVYNITSKVQKECSGECAFDMDDLVIKTLLDNSKLILENKTIQKTVELYFRFLTLTSFAETEETYLLPLLTTLERIILHSLNYEGAYKSLTERRGRLQSILEHGY